MDIRLLIVFPSSVHCIKTHDKRLLLDPLAAGALFSSLQGLFTYLLFGTSPFLLTV